MRLWAVVASTVRPLVGKQHPPLPSPSSAGVATAAAPDRHHHPLTPPRRAVRRGEAPPLAIEPNRHRRIVAGREAVGGIIDLHNMTQDGARVALTGFIAAARQRGERAVLVITGKGALGDGVLRRRVPDWLAEPPLRDAVAGVSEAHRRHGGEGALYVALRR